MNWDNHSLDKESSGKFKEDFDNRGTEDFHRLSNRRKRDVPARVPSS